MPGLSLREVDYGGAERTLLVADVSAPAGAPCVIMTAGVHGDEPAASWALLSIARDGLLDRAFGYRIWPCTNPSGYRRGTRENADGNDVNRSFGRGGTSAEARAMIGENRGQTFALNLDLHEDFEADGFYCYEPKIGDIALGPAIVRAMDEAGFPVQELHETYDLGYSPEVRHVRVVERGRVVPDVQAETDAFEGRLPHSMFLLQGTARRSLTFESPRRLPWDERVAIHRIAVVTALSELAAT